MKLGTRVSFIVLISTVSFSVGALFSNEFFDEVFFLKYLIYNRLDTFSFGVGVAVSSLVFMVGITLYIMRNTIKENKTHEALKSNVVQMSGYRRRFGRR